MTPRREKTAAREVFEDVIVESVGPSNVAWRPIVNMDGDRQLLEETRCRDRGAAIP